MKNCNKYRDYNKYKDFNKIIHDFIKDLLTTFPDILLEKFDNNLKYILTNYSDICDISVEDYNKSINKYFPEKDNNSDTQEKDNNSDTQEKDNNINNDSDSDSELENSENKLEVNYFIIKQIYNYCSKVYPERFFDVLYQNNKMFTDDTINTNFLPGIDFKLLWKENISDKTRENIWKYFQLILFSIITNVENKNTFGNTADLFEAINEDEFKDKLEDTIKNFESFFDVNNSVNVNDSEINDNSNNNTNIPNSSEIHDHINNIMNGKLGNLAKELAEETAKDFDLNDDDLKNGNDAFKKLFKNPQKLINLVKNVGSKLDQKMKTGDIKENELFEEATNMFKNMKNMPGMENMPTNMQDILKNFNIGDMMKNMMPPGAKFNENAFKSKMQETEKQNKIRERMKNKLESNKHLEINKGSGEEVKKENTQDIKNSIKNNIDFLFNNNNNNDLNNLNNNLNTLVEEMKIQNKLLSEQKLTANIETNSNEKKKKKKHKKH